MIQAVLAKHLKWLNNQDGGERANLSGAVLSGANLSDATLGDAFLWGAYLGVANLRGATGIVPERCTPLLMVTVSACAACPDGICRAG
jgi:uncharacterized protein YjbI with pentapeptide repeats